MRRQQVPLWVALILKSQDKCSIVPPVWLNLIYLKERYAEEVKRPLRFSDLPWHWLEISRILLAKALDDLPDPSHQLRSVIQDIREIRLLKSQNGLGELNESNIELTGLSMLEINELRPFVLTVMDKLRQLHSSSVDKDSTQGPGEDDAGYDYAEEE